MLREKVTKQLTLVMLCATAACAQSVASFGSEVERGSVQFLRLPGVMTEIAGRQLPEDDKKRLLIAAFNRTCTEPLLTRLVDWTKSTSLASDDYPEVIQSIRSAFIDRPFAGPELDGESATVTYAIETKEIFSLSSNLASVDELFVRYRISNMSKGDALKLIKAAHVPELVELQVTAQKFVGLELRKVGDTWKVSQVSLEPRSAILVVRVVE